MKYLSVVALHHHHTSTGDPLVKLMPGTSQFILFHCQRTLGVKYDSANWVKRAREHPSSRVVVQVLAESKRWAQNVVCVGGVCVMWVCGVSVCEICGM